MEGSAAERVVLRLDDFDGAVLDLDGVVTDTAGLHAAAWQALFDEALPGTRPFDADRDYRTLIDGRPRVDGVAAYLTSRGIELPPGRPSDPPSRRTVCGLANRKDELFRERLRGGARQVPGTVSFVRALRAAGKRIALVTASRNCHDVLAAAAVPDLFDVIVDGEVAAAEGLAGKPDPAAFLFAAGLLESAPARTLVVEDALAGVEAGRRGGFGLVVGLDRHHDPPALMCAGADVVVDDLTDLPTEPFLADPLWSVVRLDDPTSHGGRQLDALFALGDGRIGLRGDLESRRRGRDPLTLVAGAYGTSGADGLVHLLPGPSLQGSDEGEGPSRWVLDLRHGLVAHHAFEHGSWTSVRFAPDTRAASLVVRRLAGRAPAEPEPSPPLRPPHLADPAPLAADLTYDGGEAGERIWWASTTSDRATVVACAADRDVERFGRHGRDRLMVVRTGLPGEAGLRDRAAEAVAALESAGFEALLAEHGQAWRQRWDAVDIELDGDDEAQVAIRFALFQLLSAVPPDDEAGVGARGLTGLAYSGHVFWDADAFVLPALAAIHPGGARAMLGYRVARLPAARRAAAACDRAGARFPWESADTGEEVAPTSALGFDGAVVPILTGSHEEHVTACVAWAAIRYGAWTGDAAFLAAGGRELVVETARYWASRVRSDPDGRAHIDAVMGPDEYHEVVDDNAFTNVMARWNLRRGASMLGPGGSPEATRWRRLADSMVDGYDPTTGRHEQFAGYRDLEPLRISEVTTLPVAADVLLGRERVARSQVVKQPDVLMLHHLVPDEVPRWSLAADLAYYLPRTAHGSSLSPAICASLLARAGRPEDALALFDVAARLDLDDLNGNTGGGLHLATFGGVWQAVVHGFAGVRPKAWGIEMDPHLPPRWRHLRIGLRHGGEVMRVDLRHDRVSVTADAPRFVAIGGRVAPTPACFERTDDGWRPA